MKAPFMSTIKQIMPGEPIHVFPNVIIMSIGLRMESNQFERRVAVKSFMFQTLSTQKPGGLSFVGQMGMSPMMLVRSSTLVQMVILGGTQSSYSSK